jgi:1-deoxy-D-xylulose-5-phosphate synthase
MVVSAPMNESELRNLMYTAQLDENKSPFTIRYPRGQGVMPEWKTPFEKIEIGKGRVIREGEDVAILTFGHPGNFAVEACRELAKEDIRPAHYDMRFAKPLDEAMLHDIAARFDKIVTVEDGTVVGGFGSAVLEFMNQHGYKPDVRMLGIPDRYVEHGKPEELHRECGYDAAAIAATLREIALSNTPAHTGMR